MLVAGDNIQRLLTFFKTFKNYEMEKKFNKANVSDLILEDISFMQRNFCFDPKNGTNQLKGKDQNTIIHYGKYIALIRLHEDLFGNDKNFYS